MAKRKRPEIAGLGDEIFGAQDSLADMTLLPQTPGLTLEEIEIDRIQPNPFQPRRQIEDNEALEELAASIRERGILQPIRVRAHASGYQLIAGERRWRAARMAGLETVSAVVVEATDADMRIEALVENLQREDLNDMDRARAMRELKDALNLTWDQVGDRLGLSRRTVMRLVGLTKLPDPIQEMIAEGQLTEKHGRALRHLEKYPERQIELAQKAARGKISGDETVKLVDELRRDPEALKTGEPVAAPRVSEEAARVLDALYGANERLGKLRRALYNLPQDKRARHDILVAIRALIETITSLQDALDGRIES
ncbi:MAG: ParB/RepB/Spo0J family partition protein [Armatimonadetes bacterium]|nr:ParB/RepB/Spo0J family partition protein [Armatimonadota bacterium]MDI9586824.1 ParB/RepB/Spo0J family partition protein [Acidobacteriota bacterium]